MARKRAPKHARRNARPPSAMPAGASNEPRLAVDDAALAGVVSEDTHSRVPRLALALLALFVLATYVGTLCPSVAGGDSGELIVAARTWGIAHPPGYPLYTLIGHLMTLVPWGNVAERVNLLSALCNAGAAVVLAAAVMQWSRMWLAGIVAGALFAWSPLVWTYSSVAEVFALNNLFAAGLVYLSVKCSEYGVHRTASLGALWIGLGLSNHLTLIFYAVPWCIWMLWRGGSALRKPRVLLELGALLGAGLLPYVYLVVAGRSVPALGWGDTTTLQGLLNHVLRSDYGTFRLGADHVGDEGAATRLALYLESLPSELSLLGLSLALLGAVVAVRERCFPGFRSVGALWLSALFVYSFSFAALANLRLDEAISRTVQTRFWQLSTLLVCVFAGLGFAWCAAQARELVVSRGAALRIWGPRSAALMVGGLLLLRTAAHYEEQNQRGNWAFRDYGAAILQNLPERAILLTQGDHILGALRYLQLVDGVRPDVAVLEQNMLRFAWSKRWANANFPDIVFPKDGRYAPDGFSLRDFLEANLGRSQIFVVNGFAPWDHSFQTKYAVRPYGFSLEFVERVGGQSPEPEIEAFRRANQRVLEPFDAKRLDRFPEGTWESLILQHYYRSCQLYWSQLLLYAVRQTVKPDLLEAGIRGLERTASDFKDAPPGLFKTLGRAYYYLSASDPSARAGMQRHWQRYLASNPAEDAETQAIRAELGKPPQANAIATDLRVGAQAK